MNQEKLITYIVKTANTKELLKESLDLLEDAGIDYLSIEENQLKELNHIVFHNLLKNPNEAEKKLLSEIWNYKDGVYRKVLSYACEDSVFGRHLLEQVISADDSFVSIYNNGSLKELKDFLIKKTDFFQTFNSYQKLLDSTLSKVIFCQSLGFKVDNRILHQVIESEELLIKPEKLLDFIKNNEKNVTPEQWDGLLIKLLRNSSQLNNDSNIPKSYKINDALSLFSLFKLPQENQLSNIISSSFLKFSKTGKLLNSNNLEISEEDFLEKYMPVLKSFNQAEMLKVESFDTCLEYFGKDYLKQCVAACLPDMLSTEKSLIYNMPKDYLEREGLDLKAYTNSEYRNKLNDESFCKELLAQTYQTVDRATFTKILNVINKDKFSFQTGPIYEFFNTELSESETKNKFLDKIKSKMYDNEFEQLLTVIRLEMNLGEKPNDKKKIKI
jgi:hypothetical protein